MNIIVALKHTQLARNNMFIVICAGFCNLKILKVKMKGESQTTSREKYY